MSTRTFRKRTAIPASAETLYRWHERPGAFQRLNPPWDPVEEVERTDGATPIADGVRVRLRVPVGPFVTRWDLEHCDVVPGRQFRDVQRHGPFERWTHLHRTEPAGDGASVLDDEITYELPLPPLGDLAGGWLAEETLERLFTWRHMVTTNDLARHQAVAGRGAQRIAVTGATGFLGAALLPFLTTGGHTVLPVSRRPAAGGGVRWDPARGELDPRALEGVDAVVHLAGENVGQRWTSDARRRILDSRVQGTGLVARTLAAMERPPRVLVCASGAGYYGDTGDRVATESSPRGSGFLADVVQAWEDAAEPARAAGIRVVHVRMGVVLGAGGGALDRLLLPFRLGLGGNVGDGRQWMSWIARDDAVGLLHWLLFADGVSGPVNGVAPDAVRNADFTRTLAHVLGRPTLGVVPAFALRTVYGQMADETLLISQRVASEKLEPAGFRFLHPTLEEALRFELGR